MQIQMQIAIGDLPVLSFVHQQIQLLKQDNKVHLTGFQFMLVVKEQQSKGGKNAIK